jgi:Glycosyl transferase family 2/Glycosyltransferase sugar-binding region containing DXD motif
MSIPKIIHQLWIGSKPAPLTLMNTWKEKNPDFEYIFWNEAEIVKKKMVFRCQDKIDDIEEINGKADIMRWEILYKYGGVFLDADSICIEPIDEELLNKKCFAGWEHEEARPGLIATGTMGFPIHDTLVKNAIEWILQHEVSQKKGNMMAWQSVGPGLLTRMYNVLNYTDLYIFPSYSFLPIHLTGREYCGHGKIYAFQAWGSTKQSYDDMNNMVLPSQFLKPKKGVSILVSSYNTSIKYIKECLESIKHQVGYYTIELVWINDGSDSLETKLLEKLLDNFIRTTRFTKLVYYKNEQNKGIGYTLNKGIEMCSHELIIKMDSDDIMVLDRIQKQMEFMEKNPSVMICGSQILCFKDSIDNIVSATNHKSITWEEYKRKPSHWISNHPTLCYRKTAVICAGNYDITKSRMTEDFEIAIRMLKTYGYLHNLEEPLLYYRLHDKQVTNNGGTEGRDYWHKIRTTLIDNYINT